ncbi:hypothetical protein HK103_001195 [Boothiomyces macroporosus]|uniref:N-acetyltransferase domain-containing protein n=1 Tax=Boothiomyces macroporosus TaxID=261099 RepID=A0AAD5UKM0_9FUNG|nr:hypothetical protein HK103_001195 [Boothiomyces macroporosus]
MNIRKLRYPDLTAFQYNRLTPIRTNTPISPRHYTNQMRFKESREKYICKLRGLTYYPKPKVTRQSVNQAIKTRHLFEQKQVNTIEPYRIKDPEYRKSNWKWNKITCKYSPQAKLCKLQRMQRNKRQERLDLYRGLIFSGNYNFEKNLGNFLHITNDYNRDLSMARIQNILLPPIPNKLKEYGFVLHRFKGEPVDVYDQDILDRAETLVSRTFGEKDILMDLIHTKEDGFTTEVIVDDTHDQIVAAQEFVFMEKYIWIESFVVSNTYRGQGIGKELMER